MPRTTPCPACGRANPTAVQRCVCGEWNPDWDPNVWQPPRRMSWFLLLVVAVSILSILNVAKQFFFPSP
jgi:hypothetical protein